MSNTNRNVPIAAKTGWNQRFLAKGSKLGLPMSGTFELTTRCNFNCKMCYVHDNQNNQKELSAKEWLALGKEAADCGTVFLLLTGGEPFLREDFFEIYSGLKKQGLLMSINTNASLLDDSMIRYLAKEPPLRMNVSLYGASDESYRQLCGQPSYEKVTNNIRALRDAGIQVRINASFTPYNACDILGIYRFAQDLDLHIKATSYMFPPIRLNDCQYGDAPHRFAPEEAAEKTLLCREQYLTAEQLGVIKVEDSCGDLECTDGQGDPMHCRAGKTAFWITWDGRMLPCGMFPWEGYSVPHMGFKPAWEAVRRDCAALRLPAKCTSCGYRNVCTSCAAACLAECGNFEQPPEYFCRMTRHLVGIIREKYGREEPDGESK